MQGWKMTLGLSGVALGAALVAPRLFPILGEAPPEPVPVAEVEADPDPLPEPAPAPEPRNVDIVIALDTSGSMNKLIDSTRARLWDIINEVDRQDPDATLRVGLITFGSPRYGVQNDYVKIQVPLTEDLDTVYEVALGIRTGGGEEYVGATIDHALRGMDWSPEDNSDNRRILFVAGNESAMLGPVGFNPAARQAVAAGVIVNTLFAGEEVDGVRLGWDQVANLGGGQFLAIDTARSAVAVSTPYDRKLATLNAQLNSTYISYNQEGAAKIQQIRANDRAAAAMGAGNLASRAATKSSKKHRVASWDLIAGVESGTIDLDAIDDTKLPAEMQNLEKDQLQARLLEAEASRIAAKRAINEIQQQRVEYLAEQVQPDEAAGLDQAIAEVLASQL